MKRFFLPIKILILIAFTATSFGQPIPTPPVPVRPISKDINTYVLFAYDELVFKGATIASGKGYITGDIGVNNLGGNIFNGDRDLAFGTSGFAKINDGYQAVGDSVRTDDGASFWDLWANKTMPNPFKGEVRNGYSNWTPPIFNSIELPVFPFVAGRSYSVPGGDFPLATDLKVNGAGGIPSPYFMAPGAYKDVRFNDDAVVTFGPGTYNIKFLSIGMNVTIIVDNNTILNIDSRMENNNDLHFGDAAHFGAKINIGAWDYSKSDFYGLSQQRIANFAQGPVIYVDFFSPDGWLDLGGGADLHGHYWAYRITGDPNNDVTITCSLSASALATDLKCNGICDGKIDLTVTNGVAPFYHWQQIGGIFTSDSKDLTGLCAGTYAVTITDGDCKAYATAEVKQPTNSLDVKMDINCGITPLSGEVSASPSGGTGSNYTYLWDYNSETNASITGLANGAYCVTVTDENACTTSDCIGVSCEPCNFNLDIDIEPTDVICKGSCTGEIEVTSVSGGTAPYTFVWSNGVTTTELTITGLCPGTYDVTVTDQNGCTNANEVASAEIKEPAEGIEVKVTTTNATCCHMGTALATVTGGTTAYTYVWDNVVASTASVTGLSVGTYCVTVTDKNGCTAEDCEEVLGPPDFLISVQVTPINCENPTGSADLTVIGGVTSYTYKWTKDGSPFATTEDLSNLTPGTYAVTVKDGNHCKKSTSFVLTDGSQCTQSEPNVPGVINTDLDSYVLFAFDELTWKGGNDPNHPGYVLGGNVGLNRKDDKPNDNTFYLNVGANGKFVMSPNTFLLFDVGKVGDEADVYDIHFGAKNIQSPTAVVHNQVYQDFDPPLFNMVPDADGCYDLFPPFSASDDPAYDILVTGGTLGSLLNPLEPGTYGYFEAQNGSTVFFGEGTYTFKRFHTGQHVTIYTTPCTIIQVEGDDELKNDPDFNINGDSYVGSWATRHGSNDINDEAIALFRLKVTHIQFSDNDTIYGEFLAACATSFGAGRGNYIFGRIVTIQLHNDFNTQIWYRKFCCCEEKCALNATPTPTDVTCNGQCDGKIDLTVTGATSPEFKWEKIGGGFESIDQNISGLCPGTYSVTVTDGNCVTTASAVVTQPDLLQDLTITKRIVLGAPTPVCPIPQVWSFTSNIPGYANFNITLDQNLDNTSLPACPFFKEGSITFPDVPVGTYTVTEVLPVQPDNVWSLQSVTCTRTGELSFEVTVAECYDASCTVTNSGRAKQCDLHIEATHTDVKCYGEKDGSIDVSVSLGTKPYTYKWSGNTNTGTITYPNGTGEDLAHVSGLVAGTYCVTVTDQTGVCIGDTCLEVKQPTELKADATAKDATCGINNGTATVEVTGGTTAYTYYWKKSGNGFTSTEKNISGLAPGTYCVTVTDKNGCTAEDCAEVKNIAGPSVDITPTQPTCAIPLGSATTNPSGGTTAYTYSWSKVGGGFSSTNKTITGLASGTYCVTVTDQNGCTAKANTIINQPPTPPNVSITPTQPTCANPLGSATANPSGGTTAYTYSWSKTGGGFSSTNKTITGLESGTYCVTVTDQNGCTAKANTIINQPPTPPNVSITPTQPTCANPLGSATANPSGGTTAYTYSWSKTGGGFSSTNKTITGLAPGTYCVTVTDQNGCTAKANTIINQPPTPPNVSITPTQPTCASQLGSATANPSGGTTAYTYSWSKTGGGFSSTNKTITGLEPGTYCVTVTDQNGCTAKANTIINQPPTPPNVSITPTQPTCASPLGSATANPSGGTTAYTYKWSPGGATTKTITGLVPGTYCVTVTDQNGCTAKANTIINQPPTPPNVSITPTQPTCANPLGSATANPSGGTTAYTYKWSPGGATTKTITGLVPGTYCVTVTDQNGCTAKANTTINAAPTPPSPEASATNLLCYGACTGAINLTVTGGTTAYTYKWTGPNNYSNTIKNISNLCAGTYYVTVTGQNGCTAKTQKAVTEPARLTCVTSKTDAELCATGQCNGKATVIPSGGTTAYTYKWSANANNATTAMVTGLCAGTYYVTVTDKNGCTTSCSASIICKCGGFRTQTMGGWGADPSGGNNGTYLYAKWATAFPNGITIGCSAVGVCPCPTGKYLRLSTKEAVTEAMVISGTPDWLTQNWLNPSSKKLTNTLAGQLVAATINIRMDIIDPDFSPSNQHLEDLIIASGPFAGKTVKWLMVEANKAIAGCSALPYTASQWNDALTNFNQNYHDGNSNGGFLNCPVASREEEETSFDVNRTSSSNNLFTMKAFPNPFNDQTTVEFATDVDMNGTLEVYNLTGVRVAVIFNGEIKADQKYTYSYNGSDLAAGMYLVRLSSDKGVYTLNMVKVK